MDSMANTPQWNPWTKMRNWWAADTARGWLAVFGFAYGWLFSQGIPLWDDDFTSWFWKIKDQSLFHYVWEWISPISTQPQYWGFNERPLQSIIYKLCYLISGYESWSFFLFKSAVYGGLGVMIYQWGLRLVPRTPHGRVAAICAAVFFLLTPGPLAAHILHQDLAPVAELIFLAITYRIFSEIEATPVAWSGMPSWKDPAQKAWLRRWALIAFVTYLGYKSKADVKLIPGILAAYVLLMRRHQWRFFAVPVGLMGLLAVPWGKAIFQKLPPFVPGSSGSEIGWMWQPASLERLRDFLWSSGPVDLWGMLSTPTISLAGLLGPFLLVAALAFLAWRMEAFDKVRWGAKETEQDRSRIFVFVWTGVVIAALSALPAINYIFRIRYGILPMVPMALVLAWVFGVFADSVPSLARAGMRQLPKWAAVAAMAAFAFQAGVNLNRSIAYRRSMGQVMIAVDQVYERVAQQHSGDKLVLMPDFRPYDYRPDAPKVFAEKTWLGRNDELPQKGVPEKTMVVSWQPSLWEQLEMVERFSGCRSTSVFDRVFPCPPGSGTYLMKYIGTDPLFGQAEQARNHGDLAGARRLYEQYLARHPKSLAAHFSLGLVAYQQKDWVRSDQDYAALEEFLPEHLSIVYNRALALAELKQYDGAIDRLKFVIRKEPQNYAAWINLYYTFNKAGKEKKAKQALNDMKRLFPADGEVNRLLATTPR
jgi:hypothetical protein